MLVGWGSWSQRAARVSPRAHAEVPPHPGRISSHPRIINYLKSLQLPQPGNENGGPPDRHRPARCGNPNPTDWLLISWGSWLMEPACGGSCPSGQRRCPGSPGEYKFPSPDQKSFQISTTPTTQGRERRSPGSILSRRRAIPNPIDWLLIGLGSWIQRGSRFSPRANVEVPLHPGRITPSPRMKRLSIPPQL